MRDGGQPARRQNFAWRVGASYHRGVRTTSAAMIAGVLLAASVPACGGPMAQLRTDNAKLTDDVDRLRAELRSERRQRQDLENQLLVVKDRLETQRLHPTAGATPIPTLPVEVLSPDDVPENGQLVGVTDDGAQIVYQGEANRPPIEIDPSELAAAPPPPPRPRPRKPAAPPPDFDDLPTAGELEAGVKVMDLPTRPPRQVAPVPTPAVTPVAARPARAAPPADDAATLYRRGLDALKAHDYEAAVGALRDVVTRFPRHELADNAQYWLGEAYYDQKDYVHALAEFRATVTAYPRGNKVADALLKVGFAYQALGDGSKARATLEQVVSLYPGTPSAQLAAGRLESLP